MGSRFSEQTIKLYGDVVQNLCVGISSAPLSDISQRLLTIDNRQGDRCAQYTAQYVSIAGVLRSIQPGSLTLISGRELELFEYKIDRNRQLLHSRYVRIYRICKCTPQSNIVQGVRFTDASHMLFIPVEMTESAFPIVERMVNRVGHVLPPICVTDNDRVFRDIRLLESVLEGYIFLLLDAEVRAPSSDNCDVILIF